MLLAWATLVLSALPNGASAVRWFTVGLPGRSEEVSPAAGFAGRRRCGCRAWLPVRGAPDCWASFVIALWRRSFRARILWFCASAGQCTRATERPSLSCSWRWAWCSRVASASHAQVGVKRAALAPFPHCQQLWHSHVAVIGFKSSARPARYAARHLGGARACVRRGSGIGPPNPSIERTCHGGLCPPRPAAHVKR